MTKNRFRDIRVNGVFNTGEMHGSTHVGLPVTSQPEESVARGARSKSDLPESLVSRLGYGWDVVGFSSLKGPERENMLTSIGIIGSHVLAALSLTPEDVLLQDTGDGQHIFLPPSRGPIDTLPRLLAAWLAALDHYNATTKPPLRVRVAMVYGLAHQRDGVAGIDGPAIIQMARIKDSHAARAEAAKHPDSYMVMALSEELYSLFVDDGYSFGLRSSLTFTPFQERGHSFRVAAL